MVQAKSWVMDSMVSLGHLGVKVQNTWLLIHFNWSSSTISSVDLLVFNWFKCRIICKSGVYNLVCLAGSPTKTGIPHQWGHSGTQNCFYSLDSFNFDGLNPTSCLPGLIHITYCTQSDHNYHTGINLENKIHITSQFSSVSSQNWLKNTIFYMHRDKVMWHAIFACKPPLS